MRQAVIVSTARTPIGKAYRGAFNNTQAQELAAHAISNAVQRAGLEGGEVEDVILGAALQQGSSGGNVARQAVLRAGLPDSVSGMTIDRQCSSGLMAIATAAKQIVDDGMQIAVGGGVESISLVQNDHMNNFRAADPWLKENKPSIYMPMLHTAEIVAERYGVTREQQDEFALVSQQRTAAAQDAGRFDLEIVPLPSIKQVQDKETGEIRSESVTLTRDEGNRASTTLEGLSSLRPVLADGTVSAHSSITAGNSSQLSDGASSSVLMEAGEAERRGLAPLGIYRGMAVAGLRSRRDGHRTGVRDSASAGSSWAEGRRHRSLGTQRGLRLSGPVLPRQARDRSREVQRRRRRYLRRPSVRNDGGSSGRPCSS